MATFSGMLAMLPGVLRVSTEGNDSTGGAGRGAFRTVKAALAQATAGQLVWVLPGSYDETPPLTMPDGVSLRGMGLDAVAVRALNVSIASDLLIMGETCRVEDLSLRITTASNVQIRAVVLPGTTAATSKLRTVTVVADNSAAGTAATANVYAVQVATSTPTAPLTTQFWCRASTLTVTGAGSGVFRTLLNNSPGAAINLRDSGLRAVLVAGSSGSAIALETANSSAAIVARYCTIEGTSSDIAQTSGTLTVGNTNLVDSTANGLGFATAIQPSSTLWAINGAMPSTAGTYYLWFGTVIASALETVLSQIPQRRFTQRALVLNLSVRCATGPGGTRTDTWTVYRNGVATALTLALTGASTQAQTTAVSVSFAAGDTLALGVTLQASCATTNAVAQVDVY